MAKAQTQALMQITIRIDKNYGIETAYPMCKKAEIFARIAGTKSITHGTLALVVSLGYEIIIAQEKSKSFKNFQVEMV